MLNESIHKEYMKLAVIGSRTFNDYPRLKMSLDVYNTLYPITLIVSGGARGTDSLAERYAEEKGIPMQIFPAQWNKYGRSAGYKRNRDIIMACDKVYAFWDMKSTGTGNSIELAKKLGKPVSIVSF